MRTCRLLTIGLALFIFNINVRAAVQEDFIEILESEIIREFDILKEQTPPVHYMDYRVEALSSWRVGSFMGSLVTVDSARANYVNAEVRVGSKEFDNTHIIKGEPSRRNKGRAMFPVETGERAMRNILWKLTDDKYNKAKDEFTKRKNKIKVEIKEPTLDFAPAEPVRYYEEKDNENLSEAMIAHFTEMTKKASALFLADTDMKSGSVDFSYRHTRKYLVSSEGHSIVQNFPLARITISGSIRSEEGNVMSLFDSFEAFTPEDLPATEKVMAATKAVVDKLIELKNAPMAEPYSGPAILSPAAAGVFFHEIFGHRIEGHRLKDDTDAQTFKQKVGTEVLPKTFNVVFDPSIKTYNNWDLHGYYQYDDQGVLGDKVDVVTNGVLKEFLMCRTPINGFKSSNGHGRGDINSTPVTRQSNMFITTNKPYSETDLRKMLIKSCKKQKLEYGYYFKSVTGGFTTTGRYQPNAFNVTPNEVYRVYADGRPDELVRGVDLIGTPLSMFSTIVAAGDTEGLFNGYCGAESGRVPVATISPAIFVGKVETQKKSQQFSTGPILPPPVEE